jgi:hypothetical protein
MINKIEEKCFLETLCDWVSIYLMTLIEAVEFFILWTTEVNSWNQVIC